MFFKNKLERLLERICVIVLCVITAVMAIPVKSMTAAGPASVVLEILHEEDTVNVKFEMVSNPGIAGMSFKLCYDSSLLSIVSVDETLDSFKSSIINPDGDGFVGYAYAQAKDCKDTGTVFSITFKINRENEKELTYESVYIDEFDTCDSNLEDVNTDIKVQFSDKNAQNIQNKQNLQNTPEEQAGVKGQSDSINKSDSMDKSDSKNNETLKDTNSDGGKNENISKDINGTEENSVSLIEVNSSDTVKSTNIVIVIVIAGFLSLCLIATTVLVSTGNAFASDANVGELAVTSAQGSEGDTVKVTVSYNNNQGTSGFEFRMYYDPDVLELVKTTLSEDVFIEDVVILGDKNANEKMTNFVSYAVAMAKENKKSGELYTVEFKIKDGVAIGKHTAVTES